MTKFIIKSLRFLYRKAGFNFSENVKKKQTQQPAVLPASISNDYFKKVIASGKPAMLSRLGTPESNCILNWIQVTRYRSNHFFGNLDAALRGNTPHWNEQVKTDLQNLVGFFPATDEQLLKFAPFYAGRIALADGMGIWGFVPGENFIIDTYCPNVVKYNPEVLDPYFFDAPWTAQLEGKKVLVIHPFTDSIVLQYKKRQLLFQNKAVLPAFELQTLKAVQSIAGNKTPFNDWFEAFDFMKEKINRMDFDIALIAAGSYGLPLAAHVKSIGKSAIHMGGSLQILFGIKGKRWDDHAPTRALYNEHWVRPDAGEIVNNAEIVEGGCYW